MASASLAASTCRRRWLGAILGVPLAIGACGEVRPQGADAGTEGAEPVGGGSASELAVDVVRVIDGDSFELAGPDGVLEVRLDGVNTPELYRDNQPTCQGEAASAFAEAQVVGADLVLIAGETDRYGRTIGELLVDGVPLADTIVEAGHGLATGDDAYLRRSMLEAADARLGIWGEACGPPVGGVELGGFNVDPAGDDRINLAEEWVEVRNVGDRPVDLAGWILRDDTTSHCFELSGSLAVAGELRIHTGEGSDTETDRYLGERFPVWSNRTETVILADPGGAYVDWAFLG